MTKQRKNFPENEVPLAAFMTLALCAGMAQAADIAVDGTTCALADAITSANTDTASGGCIGGNGADTLTLEADVSLTTPLPRITSTVTIEGAGHTIDGNNDPAVGSVLFIEVGDLTLNQTTVTGGNAQQVGGGIRNHGNLSLNDSTISGNSAVIFGGGIHNYLDSNLILTNSTVSQNSAQISGGGIYSSPQAIVTINNSTVSGNSAVRYGGGMYNFFASNTTLNNSTISGNSAVNVGGGMYNLYTDLILNNSTVSGNSTQYRGGGIHNHGNLTLNTSIVSGNQATILGSEISNDAFHTTTADNNNLLGDSSKTNARSFDGFTPGASDVTASSDGTNPTTLAAILAPLADNGGSTWTHALVTGSPAIDLAASSSFATDQRRYPRPVGADRDTGAYEYGSGVCGSGRTLTANTWMMTAPPCAPNPPGIVDQLGPDLGGIYGSTWISFTWDADAQNYGTPQNGSDPLVQGIGNWHYSTNAGLMLIEGTVTPTIPCPASMAPARNCFQIGLTVDGNNRTKWNLVGHPFPVAVAWANARISANGIEYTPSEAQTAGLIQRTCYSWNGNSYDSFDDVTPGMNGSWQPQAAYWLNTMPTPNATAIDLFIPQP